MSSANRAIDLTSDETVVQSSSSASVDVHSHNRKRKAIDCVYIAMHQLEAQYDGVGDFTDARGVLSHYPTRFDSTILGVYRSHNAANNACSDYCLNLGWFDDEDDDEADEEFDYVGEGKFKDGAESGDSNTFSERIFIQIETLHDEEE